MPTAPALPEISLVMDSDVLTDWRYNRSETLRAIRDYIGRLKKPPALTAVGVFEALQGFEKIAAKVGGGDERTQEDRKKTEQLIQTCEVLPFDHAAAAVAAYIFPRLSQSDRNKHWRDIFIAATALAHNHGVATRNQRDFEIIAQHLPPAYPFLRLAVWKS